MKSPEKGRDVGFLPVAGFEWFYGFFPHVFGEPLK